MIHFPNCKINLGLHITAKRNDGYHEIESVFYPIPLHDAIEIIPSETLHFESQGIEVPGEINNNIILKAYHLFKQDFPHIPPFDIFLLKKIPTGAGLGGGSSDGTEMLKLMNTYCDLGIDKNKLIEYASMLGSDCPFFVENKPALAHGRGEILEPISLDLSSYQFVIIKPLIHISTATAFSIITPTASPKKLEIIIQQPMESWKRELTNDFEIPIFKLYPQIKKIKEDLYDLGAVYCAMSGSGSAVYAIFETKIEASTLRHQFASEEVFVC